jgi:hypothetical protein
MQIQVEPKKLQTILNFIVKKFKKITSLVQVSTRDISIEITPNWLFCTGNEVACIWPMHICQQ